VPAAAQAGLLAEAIEAWRDAREGLVEEVALFAPAELDFRPQAESRSVRELVWHVVETARMWCGELSREGADFTRQGFQAFIQEYGGDARDAHTGDELVSLLRRSLEEGVAALEGAGEARMLRPIRRFDGERWSRLSWMHHGIAHEMYHRGQVALCHRLLGRTPALTRRITG
jgi:uncharacterized damage-inducible protein DinB